MCRCLLLLVSDILTATNQNDILTFWFWSAAKCRRPEPNGQFVHNVTVGHVANYPILHFFNFLERRGQILHYRHIFAVRSNLTV